MADDKTPKTPKAPENESPAATARKAAVVKTTKAAAPKKPAAKKPAIEQSAAQKPAASQPSAGSPGGAVAAAAEGSPRKWKRISVIAGFSVLGAVTLYLGVVTLLWAGAMDELRTTQDNLRTEIDDSATTLNELRTDVRDAKRELQEAHDSIVGSADEKARSQDHADMFAGYALLLKDCAEAREELIGLVKERHLYTYGSQALIREWEAETNQYCDPLGEDLTFIAEQEDSL